MSSQLITDNAIVKDEWVTVIPPEAAKEVRKQAGKVVMFKLTGEDSPSEDQINATVLPESGKILLPLKVYLKNKDEIIPSNLHSLNYKFNSTGGSSGAPLKFLLDIDSWSFTTANKIYNWGKIGFNHGDSHIAIGSSSLFPNSNSWKHSIYHWLKNEIPLNGMNMSSEVMPCLLITSLTL